MAIKKTGAQRPRTARTREAHAEHLLPAVCIDANYLQGIALCVRRVIQETVLPGLLEMCVSEAQCGQLELLFVPASRELDPLTMCEALQPELKRLGFSSKIINHTIPRLGMTEEPTALAVSWREPNA